MAYCGRVIAWFLSLVPVVSLFNIRLSLKYSLPSLYFYSLLIAQLQQLVVIE